MEEAFLPVIVVGMLFIGLPWIILHYMTRWRTSSGMTQEDEDLLDALHDTARRLEDRLITIERIVAADNPDFRPDFGSEFRPEPRTQRGAVDDDPATHRRSN